MTIPNTLDKETFKAHEHYPFKARSHQNPNRGEITKETKKSTFIQVILQFHAKLPENIA
jgi:hypothetical protein